MYTNYLRSCTGVHACYLMSARIMIVWILFNFENLCEWRISYSIAYRVQAAACGIAYLIDVIKQYATYNKISYKRKLWWATRRICRMENLFTVYNRQFDCICKNGKTWAWGCVTNQVVESVQRKPSIRRRSDEKEKHEFVSTFWSKQNPHFWEQSV